MKTAQHSPENMIPIKEFNAAKQTGLFQTLKRSEITGQISLKSPQGEPWIFYLERGEIVYATGGTHPIRRWRRNLAIYLPQINADFTEIQAELNALAFRGFRVCWEYDILSCWIGQQKVTREQVNNFIKSVVVEVLFDLTQGMEAVCAIQQNNSVTAKMELIEAQEIVAKTERTWLAWQAAKLGDLSPNLAPMIKQPEKLKQHTSLQVYQNLVKLLDKEKTLRDVAAYMKRDLLQVSRSLLPYIQLGVIGLVEVPDLPPMISSEIINRDTRPLIVCVDDSPTLCYMMEKVLKPAGYRFTGINDALRAIKVILELKPDLIFLDVVMPNLNGYELCTQLRKIPQFRNIPIIFLTGKKGIIDRVKANLAGCSDFLSKDADAWIVQRTIRKHLKQDEFHKGNKPTSLNGFHKS